MERTGYCGGNYCENCAKENTCQKTIKYFAGFCNSDFQPKSGNVTWKEESHADQSGIKSFVLSFDHPKF